MQLCIWMCSGILKRNTFRVEIKSVRLYNFNSDRVIYENWRNKLLHCNCSSQWVFKCVLRQLVKIDWVFKCVLRQLVKIDLKSDMAIAFTSARRTSWSLSRTTGEESQLWMIRTQLGLWKRVPLKQNIFYVLINWDLVSIWRYQTANDETPILNLTVVYR